MPNDILRREAERLRHLSETCAQQGDYSTARQLLKMVIEIEESDVAVTKEALAADFHELGWICVCMDSKQEAQQYLQLALDLRLACVQHDAAQTQQTADLLQQVLTEMHVAKPSMDFRTSH
jgi:alkyl sulfatase BDS1-like metallo-beta-lactamase superfamily hydrolase